MDKFLRDDERKEEIGSALGTGWDEFEMDNEREYIPYAPEDMGPVVSFDYEEEEYVLISEQKEQGCTFEDVQRMPLEQFKEWVHQSQCVNGRWIDPIRDVNWITGTWADRAKAMYLYQCKSKSAFTPIHVESVEVEVPPYQPVHTASFKEAGGYEAMSSYRDKVQDSHRVQLQDILDQIPGVVIAPADGYGAIKELRPEAISGDKYGTGVVHKETIGETLDRGGPDLPVILSYCSRFLTDDDTRKLVERRGPVVILDEWPISLARGDLKSVGHGMTAYGIGVEQRTYFPDNSKIRPRVAYDWNLKVRVDGYNWLSWNTYLWYMVRQAPHLRHWSPQAEVRDILRKFGVLALKERAEYAAATISELERVPMAYFCPLGRHSPIVNLYTPSNWLLGGVVYRVGHIYYEDISDEGYVMGHVGQVKEGIKFLRPDFEIVEGRDACEGTYVDRDTGMTVATRTEASLMRFATLYFPEYHREKAKMFQRKIGHDVLFLLGPKLFEWAMKYHVPARFDADDPAFLRAYQKEYQEYITARRSGKQGTKKGPKKYMKVRRPLLQVGQE
jgi:hypothetical protein